jgi:hypothetical protein
MHVGSVKVAIVGFVVITMIWLGSASTIAASETSSQDGFTAVAGTESVVMDRRQKNNATLLSGFLLVTLVLLVAGALKHSKPKRTTKD